MLHLRDPRFRRPLALALGLVALGSATSAQALPGATPTTTAGAGATSTPATTSVTPTTTYVPAGGVTAQPSAVPSGSATTTPTISSIPTSATRPTALPDLTRTTARPADRGLSTGAIVIAALAALLALGCAAWGLAHRRAFEPRWWLSLRHAMAEAGFRASATWAEFSDWVRLGH